MERIERSFRLVQQSYRILMHDKELMILPLISGLITIAVAVSFFFGFGITEDGFREGRADTIVPVFLFYVVTYAIGIFFQAAVVAGATDRMRGGDPTVASALATAWGRIGSILMWAVVAATVGTILRAIHDRSAFIGKIVAGLLGGICLTLFFAALQGVYIASLYRFATEGKESGGFDHDLMANAFRPK